MPKVLLGQDGGDGFGHVAQMAPIATALADHGLEVRLALRAPRTVADLLEPLGLTAVQAPLAQIPARPDLDGLKTSSYADLLVRYSLDREPWLFAVTRAWDELIDDFRPDLVVADFAPVLALAARGRVPVVHVGNGYTVPPASGERFPKFRDLPDWVAPERLLATFNAVQQRRGLPQLQRLPELLQGAAAFVTCLTLLDPYRALRGEPTLGPLRPLPPPADPPGSGCFAYLAADYVGTATVLEVLAAGGRACEVYLRHADAGLRDHWRRRGLVMHDLPQSLAEAAGRAAIVVHHGGINTTEAVLALGRPQLFVPRHVEQSLNAHMAMALGIGVALRNYSRFRAPHVAAALTAVETKARIKAAEAVAGWIAAGGPHHGLERIVATCLDLAGGGSNVA